MKVRIYKSGGNTGQFISKLSKFLPDNSTESEAQQLKELKEKIQYQLDDNNQSENTVVMQLIKAGYDFNYAKALVDDISNEMEEDYYRKKNSKKSMMDSDLIPNEDELEEEEYKAEEEKEREKRKAASRDMQDVIAQTAEEASDEDDDDMYDESESPYEDLAEAEFGMQVSSDKVQWPGMYNDIASLKNGGIPNKKKFINSTVKQLKKAAEGMQKDPTANEMPNPFGTLDNPLGINLTPNKSVVSAIKDTAQNFVNNQAFKQQAENMYNQQYMQPMVAQGGADDWATNLHNYGEALSHQMPNQNMNFMNTDFDGQQMAFGGTSRRVRRANRAFFGLPIAPPGAKTNYEFGPLGGLRKGQVEYDLGQIGQLLKTNPQLANMLMPQIATGVPSGGLWNRWTSNSPNYGMFNQSYSSGYSTSYDYGTPKTRLKWATETINNQADPGKNPKDADKLNNNPDLTDKKKKYQDYIDWYASIPVEAGMSKGAPSTFEEFTTKGDDGLSDYDWWVKTRGTNSSSTPEVKVENKSATVNPPARSSVRQPSSSRSNSSNRSNSNATVTPPSSSDPSQNASTINKANAPKTLPKKTQTKNPNAKSYASDDSDIDYWNLIKKGITTFMWPGLGALTYEEGGFVDFDRPDLNRFIYGGNEYAYGGGVPMYPDGGNIDPNVKDPAGRNYQGYIDWYNQTPLDKGMSRAAPQTWAEWKAEQDAEKKPQGTNTNTGTNTNQGATTYNQDYFKKLFEDPAAKAEFEKYMQSQGLPTNSQLQQRQQQGQGNSQLTDRQGTPVIGFGAPNQNFGSAIGSLFGFNKDFNYYTSPQGQITREMISQMMQGKNPTGKVTETKFKDRGKWWNPFDTKRVTEWTVDNAGQPIPAATTTQGPANAPGTSGDNKSMAPTNNVGPVNTGENTGIDQTPDDWQYNQPAMNYMKQSLTLGQGNGSTNNSTVNNGFGSNWQLPGQSPEEAQQSMDEINSMIDQSKNKPTANIPDTGVNEDIPEGSFLQTSPRGGIDRQGNIVEYNNEPEEFRRNRFDRRNDRQLRREERRASRQSVGPNLTVNNEPSAPNVDPSMALGNRGPEVTGASTNPMWKSNITAPVNNAQPSVLENKVVPEQLPENFLMNTSGPMNTMDEGMAYGGYVPAYMAYGGYMPDYGFGGYYPDGGSTVVGPNSDFAGVQQNNIAQDKDNNGIPDYLEFGKDPDMGADANKTPDKLRIEEQSGWSWNPKKMGKNINRGLRAFTSLDRMAEFAKNREQQNPKYMYAQDVDRQPLYKGTSNIYGVDTKVGYETGRTYSGKFGGAKFANGGSTYAKGKVYSLTMDEINEIKRRGGSVEFIK